MKPSQSIAALLRPSRWNVLVLGALLWPALGQAQDRNEKLRQEEEGRYFQKWLNQDVLYIITPQERAVFTKLTTVEERENFVEQFWRRRDPNPETAFNDYKSEHYRRIAYANANFTSGFPGWKMDRGMIYIKFGPPDEIERNPTGGNYTRPDWEGGGNTATYPWQRWYYHYIEGLGNEVEVEFVDKSMSGEYKIAMHSDDKDALLNVPNAGQTTYEFFGILNKRDRNLRKTNPASHLEPYHYTRVKDLPFEKIQTLVKLQSAPVLNFSDLRTVVTTEVSYSDLPFQVTAHSFPIRDEMRLVPVTIEVAHKDLVYRGRDSRQEARIQVYGELKDLRARIPARFEDTMALEFSNRDFRRELQGSAMYQKKLFLPPGRYLLNTVLRDDYGDKLGTQRTLIVVPGNKKELPLSISSPMLAKRIVPLDQSVDEWYVTEPFIFPAYKVYPNVSQKHPASEDLLVYFQIHNFALDQTSLEPRLDVVCQVITSDNEVITPKELPNLIRSADYVEGIQVMPRLDLPPGRYHFRVQLKDQLAGTTTQAETRFEVYAGRDLRNGIDF